MSEKLSFPRDKIRILLLEGVHRSAVDSLRAAGYTNIAERGGNAGSADLIDALEGVHMVGIRSRTQLTAEVLRRSNKLMAVGCFCIGTTQVDTGVARTCGLPVFNAPHSNTRSVAELVMAEIVMLLRGVGDKSAAAHRGAWRKSAKNSFEVRGKTLGIVGYGHIGSQVSILAEAFGMRVLYYDIEPRLAMGNAHQLESLEQLLPQIDVLTLHVPGGIETTDLINKERIGAMAKGAVLINASRGTVVDLDALRDALQDGHLLGAAIDVFPREPSGATDPFESPLQGVANVILTPHVGGSTLEAQRNIGVEVARKLIDYSDQGSTIGAVNFPNISLSAKASAHRLLHVHHNQPGVLREINRILSESKANILGQHLQTLPDVGYVVTDVDREHPEDLRQRLKAVPGTLRCRILY